MRFLWYIIHFFKECDEKDIDWNWRINIGECKKCGRQHFKWHLY